MIRILKALGLTALAALAMSAMLASAAQAEGTKGVFTAGETPNTHKPATIVGTQYGEVNFFEAFDQKVECENSGVKFTGTLKEGGTNGNGKKLTITPHYKDCTSGARIATVTMNGCDYIFNQPTTAKDVEPDQYTGTVDLTCPHENVIEIHVYQDGTVTNHQNEVCTITVYPTGEVTTDEGQTPHRQQTLGGHVVYTQGVSETEGQPKRDDLTVEATATNITAERHGLCAIFGGNHEENGIYNSTVTVEAFGDNPPQEPHETQLDAWISKEEA